MVIVLYLGGMAVSLGGGGGGGGGEGGGHSPHMSCVATHP